MAVLIGGIGSSHAPSIAHAYDQGYQERDEWRPFFDSYARVADWLCESRVDTVVVIYNDHLNHFHFNAYPTFALGVAETFDICDEGAGRRDFPIVRGHAELAWHLAEQLLNQEFDPTICQEMQVDHGVMSVLPLLSALPWRLRVVPLHVNVLREPLPLPLRLWRLGQCIGRAIENCPEEARVAVVSTGGLSHQLQGQDFGFTNPAWDMRFLDLLVGNPGLLAQATHHDYMARGGVESVEMMLWLAMRGSLAQSGGGFQEIKRFYQRSLLTGYGLLALELSP